MNPLVLTLLTPTYNRLVPLLETLECYQAQARPDVELILIDDGSTDGSLQVVQERFPSIRAIRLETRSGPSVARNVGLREARGRYVMPLDSDCFLPPNTLDYLVSFLSQRPTGLYLFPCRSWPNRTVSTEETSEHVVSLEQLLLKSLGEVIPALPTELLRTTGLQFPEHFAGGEPYLLMQLRLITEAIFVGRVVLEYRTDIPMRISSPEYQVRYPEEIAEVLEATLPFYDSCHTATASAHRSLTLEKIGIYQLLAGRPKVARSYFQQAIQRGRYRSSIFLLAALLPQKLLVTLFLAARRARKSP